MKGFVSGGSVWACILLKVNLFLSRNLLVWKAREKMLARKFVSEGTEYIMWGISSCSFASLFARPLQAILYSLFLPTQISELVSVNMVIGCLVFNREGRKCVNALISV